MERFLDQGNTTEFDIVVIGGGVSGAAIGYEAASRGLRTAIVEKRDWGWATSAATSKLIHGGLRYLSHMEFGLVRESLRERRILEDIAPNFVYPLPFIIPNYNRLMNNRYVIKAAMLLYDILSFDKAWTRQRSKRLPVHRSLSPEETLDLLPYLSRDKLRGGVVYYDCQSVFPERLTLAFVKSAEQYGARVANYAEVTDFLRDGDRVAGVRVRDLLSGKESELRCSLVINCSGPWADRMLRRAEGHETSHTLRMSEGIHIITAPLAESSYAAALMTPSGRHFFILPWRGHSLIGTTDKEYTGSPDAYRVTRRSIEELLAEVNATLGREVVRYEDVRYAYGGLRPLTDTQTQSTYSSSRRYEIFDSAAEGAPGMITVEGGKYTTSRNLAENALKMVAKNLGRKLPPSRSAWEYLYGCEIGSMEELRASLRHKFPGVSERTRSYLARNYGRESALVLELAATEAGLDRTLNADGEILAQALYAIREEMARSLSDVLLRRTGIGSLGLPDQETLRQVAALCAGELGWDAVRQEQEVAAVVDRLRVPQGP